jgi:hypothetical protein
VYCATLGVQARVGFPVSCQLLLLDFKEKWSLSSNIGRRSQRAAN